MKPCMSVSYGYYPCQSPGLSVYNNMISALGGNTAAFGMTTDGFIWDVTSITNIPIPLFELFRLVDGDICLDYGDEIDRVD